MNRPGFKSTVYHGDSCLGEADIFLNKNQTFQFPNNEVRINHFSPPSERCPPLSILYTISPFPVRCKIESKSQTEQSLLNRLHASCFQELKTAVVLIGDEELHLVAMRSRSLHFPCFWCLTVPRGLYGSCLGMLNLRCLSIVFDLDETLIVANTMKSFEDRIEFLQRKIAGESDPLRVSGMTAELKRYMEDKLLLKQYSENDQVIDNGKLFKVQPEEVPRLSDNQEPVVRPIVRLPERNIVLTRINPEVRDTSVLVRLRPAWDELRSYLTAKGRKRFEVYVCTMAERDYALEIWRLLDPEAHLISPKQLLDRVVCVKSGSRKSLLNVFQDGFCHPKMAMVIDDRLKVWDDKDQPRVHVVPAFSPYYAPQAEMANAVPVLCVARNVACNVRGGFFKEFDEALLRKISELCYEDEVVGLPSVPDVSKFLMTEDASVVPNGNRDIPVPEGMFGAEVEQRLNRLDEKNFVDSGSRFVTNNPDLRAENAQQPVAISSNIIIPPTSVSLPTSASGEATQSELDPDMRRRLLILPHSQNIPDHSLVDSSNHLSKVPAQISAPPAQPLGGWFVAEDSSEGQLNSRASGPTQESDASQSDKHQGHHNPLYHTADGFINSDRTCHESQAYPGDERQRLQHAQSINPDDVSLNRGSANNRELYPEAGTVFPQLSSVSIGVLQEIGRRCGSKVEFRFVISTSKDLQFSVEVLFTGEKIGVGMGRTRKEAQLQAADNALHNLANKYMAYVAPDFGAMDRDLDNHPLKNENGFLRDISSSGLDEFPRKDVTHNATPEELGLLEDAKKLSVVVSGINELCMAEGLSLTFRDQPPVSKTLNKGEYYSQVEIAGKILGSGISLSRDGAKLQAAEEALGSLKSMINQLAQKRSNSPRSLQAVPPKRPKDELLRGLQSLSSSRYHKNGHPVS